MAASPLACSSSCHRHHSQLRMVSSRHGLSAKVPWSAEAKSQRSSGRCPLPTAMSLTTWHSCQLVPGKPKSLTILNALHSSANRLMEPLQGVVCRRKDHTPSGGCGDHAVGSVHAFGRWQGVGWLHCACAAIEVELGAESNDKEREELVFCLE